MPRHQSNLDSFFAVPKEKRVAKQTTLLSWNNNNNNKNNNQQKQEEKENQNYNQSETNNTFDFHDSNDHDDDDDDDDEQVLVNSARCQKTRSKMTEKRRRIIDDDDDDNNDNDNDIHCNVDDPNLDSPVSNLPLGLPASKKVKSSSLKYTAPDADRDINSHDIPHGKEDNENDDDDDDENEENTMQTDEKDQEPENTSPAPTRAKIETTKVTSKKTSAKENSVANMELDTFPDEPLSYLVFCNTMEQIEAISGRLEIQAILTNLFSHVIQSSTPTDLYDLVYLSSNSVAPAYECIELGIGDAILIKAIGEAYGTNPAIIKQQYESQGDLGTVAKVSKAKQRTLSFGVKPKPLLVHDVLAVFREISKTTGAQSQKFKVNLIKKLLVRAQGPEAKYIVRGLQGKLRIGLARSTVLIALAHAFCSTSPPLPNVNGGIPIESDTVPEEVALYRKSVTTKSKSDKAEAAVAIIKKAYSEVPSYDALLDALLKVPLDCLYHACSLTPGIPVEPMLAKPTKSIQEVLKRLNGQRFTCEFKYDGERAQVHMLEDGTFKVFSRNLLDTSIKYPEVPLYVKSAAMDKITSFVLDTEVVAFNRENGNLVPFQILSTRKKSEESAETAKVQVIVQAFDLMYLNGKSLLHRSLSERRDLLREHFNPVESKFQFAKSLDHLENGDTTVLEEFLDAAVKGQCEGLMVKTLDGNAAYEPSKRSLNWLKLKKDYLDGLGDSVDLVPLGAYYGRGKRTGVFGAYLLACYDPETEDFQSVCKLGTGFSDEDLKNLSNSFKDHIVEEKPSNYKTSDTLACDVWFDAVQVWEVKAADLSKSSTHKGAIGRTGEAGRGIGLRFPRFERVRDDKKPEQATSSEQILEMYYQQDSVIHDGAADGNDDDDGI